VYKGHFPGQARRVDEMEERGTTQDGLARSMEESRISFLIRSTYDVLPSPQNLNL